MLYNFVLFLFLICVVSLSRLSEVRSLELVHEFSTQYNTLDLFYAEVRNIDDAARSHLYEASDESYVIYSMHFEKALFLIDSIHSMEALHKHRWRMQLLKNMILTYNKTFMHLNESIPENIPNYQEHYDFLVNTAQNIIATATQYYALLTSAMEEENALSIESWQRQSLIYYIAIFAFLFVGIVFSIRNIRSITNPIEQIVNNINLIKVGHFNFNEIKNNDTEIKVLCDTFSDMAKEIDGYVLSIKQNSKLKNELLEKENENLRISKLLTQTELRALQSQVNPHFFFNTLSMISKMAYIEKAYHISEMMETVADLMRYSLDYASKTSNLFGEIECLENYITIQKQRFGHRLTFEVSLSQSIPNIDMPGMILQPLVENAIAHGVANMMSDAKIFIKAYHDNIHVYLEVTDNGIGMNQEIRELVLARQELSDRNPETKGSGIGLQNVLKRLDMFFYGNNEVLIQSEQNCGTSIIITLPIVRGTTNV